MDPGGLADDEFLSEGHFRALLCLVGVAVPDQETLQLDPPSTILAAQVRDRFHLDPSCTAWS